MSTADEDVLKRIFEKDLPARVKAGDADGYTRLWGGPTPMWCPQDEADVHGLDDIHAAVAALLAQLSIDPSFTADTAVAIGSHGYVNGTSHEEIRPRDGSPSYILDTREIWLFIKEADGWKINCMVFNHKPAPTE